MLSPSVIESGKEYPLVLFLHDSGERGDDNAKQLLHGGAVFSNRGMVKNLCLGIKNLPLQSKTDCDGKESL